MNNREISCENSLQTNSEFDSDLLNMTPKNQFTSNLEYEEKMQDMTASYSEILFEPNINSSDQVEMKFPIENRTLPIVKNDSDMNRPDKLDLNNEESFENPTNKSIRELHLEGTVIKEGDMVMFVAENLESKIKLSSPSTKNDSPSFPSSRIATPCLYRKALTPHLQSLDPNILNDIELQVRQVATSVDNLTENLAELLHSVSSLTVNCLETYRDAVCRTCDTVDSNIKSMYQLMAKCEELSKSMKPIYLLSDQIKGIKQLLDLFENSLSS